MKREVFNIAIFIDMDNIPPTFNLEKLMDSFLTSIGESDNYIFAMKKAYGNLSNINKELKQQIINHNFEITDTPKVGYAKNRADLIMSIDAFETLYQNNPSINRYCFMTSDVDFTIIGDKLRKYAAEVWLVCKHTDRNRIILTKSFDRMMFFDDYPIDATESSSYEDSAEELFVKALRIIDNSKVPFNASIINDKMKGIDPSFCIDKIKYKKFHQLVYAIENKGLVSTFMKGKVLMIRDITLDKQEKK